MTLTVITPPGEAPVSLGAAKEHLRIGHDGEDAHITRLVASATERLETAAGLVLVMRALRRTCSQWPARLLGRGHLLRPGPVTRLLRVSMIDSDDGVEDITARLRFENGRLSLRPWSILPPVAAGGRIEIDFEAGYSADAAGVPADLKLAVLMLVADSYQRAPSAGESTAGLPDAVRAILSARREIRI